MATEHEPDEKVGEKSLETPPTTDSLQVPPADDLLSESDVENEPSKDFVTTEELDANRDYKPQQVSVEHSDASLEPSILDRYGFHEHGKAASSPEIAAARDRRARLRFEKWHKMLYPEGDEAYRDTDGGMRTYSSYSKHGEARRIEHWERVRHHKKLKSRIRKGIPQQYRGLLWYHLCGAPEYKIEYSERYAKENHKDHESFDYYQFLKTEKDPENASPHARQIQKDIDRTFRNHDLFKEDNGGAQQRLKSVLCCYTMHDPELGYCQGMAAVAALCLMVMREEDAFWVLAAVCASSDEGWEQGNKYRMRLIWHPDMPLIHLRFYQVERLVNAGLPPLSAHLEEQGLTKCHMYGATKWFIGLFLPTTLPFNTCLRIFDIFLSEGYKSLFRFGIGLLKYMEADLLTKDYEGLLEIIQGDPAKVDEDTYIAGAMRLNITHRQLDRMEEDYKHKKEEEAAAMEEEAAAVAMGRREELEQPHNAKKPHPEMKRKGSDI